MRCVQQYRDGPLQLYENGWFILKNSDAPPGTSVQNRYEKIGIKSGFPQPADVVAETPLFKINPGFKIVSDRPRQVTMDFLY